ncbi:MAG: SIS domain-containing protein [Vicinamibacterales bacterium]|jgi:D-sedoheptulose 7-phosphate isomerase|nr:SIS domain-containing protein [Vicinamibacterales bacterium]
MAASPSPDPAARVRALFEEAARLHASLGAAAPSVAAAAATMAAALRDGRKVLVCGNGGSAAEAQHFAAELMGRFTRERAAWPAIALTTDTSALTAIGNDYGFERVFARQVEGLGAPGDVVLGISTSGASPNVLAAFAAAASRGLTTIALTGRDGGELGRVAAIHVNVPHGVTARVQEAQLTILHAMCELIEGELAP